MLIAALVVVGPLLVLGANNIVVVTDVMVTDVVVTDVEATTAALLVDAALLVNAVLPAVAVLLAACGEGTVPMTVATN